MYILNKDYVYNNSKSDHASKMNFKIYFCKW